MKSLFAKRYSVIFILLVFLSGAIGVTPAHAASFTVTNLNDSGPGSLRQAILDAMTLPDAQAPDAITFAVSGTIVLASTLPTITSAGGALSIDATGQALTISGNHLWSVMSVGVGAPVSLINLTITNGSASLGGGIYNLGNLNLAHCVLSANNATSGAGIYIGNGGSLGISDSTFSGNSASVSGSAIFNDGNIMTIVYSKFSNNTGPVGTVYSKSGAIVGMAYDEFSNNTASGTGSGAGIYNTNSTLDIVGNTFLLNTAFDGAAIYNASGPVTIKNTTFSANNASDVGGAVFNAAAGTLDISTSFVGSQAVDGAGIYNQGGSVTLTNDTFSGNGASAYGGAIYNNAGLLSVTNSTFSANSAGAYGGGIYGSGGTVTLRNTIVAHSISGGNCKGTITDGGNNIDDGTTCGWGSGSASMSSTDPMLGVLATHGGLTRSFALLAGSPAIDAVTFNAPNNAPPADQRDRTRPQGVRYDIGSYEADATLTLSSSGPQDGWVLESSENSSTGGTMNDTDKTLRLGDDAKNKQYRDILSFATGSGLPDDAVITGVTLKIKKNAVAGGGNPLAMLKGLMVDVKQGSFGAAALQLGDFKAKANQTVGPLMPPLLASWYSIDLTKAGLFINALPANGGLTQIRLRSNLDDNNNAVANYLSLFSGNASLPDRPQLIISFYVP